ncbi:hypothetical protein BDN67DRAFT_687254 [Paxillus ammoniavirescens]|nr:hypothetical protein BDN67DRAFT_687254 [Paxillus ammoniavirescens]
MPRTIPGYPHYFMALINDWHSLFGLDFRSQSHVVSYRNESWSFANFARMQARYVVPEIDTLGHSLVILQWRFQLMLNETSGTPNLTYPETIPIIQSIWAQFISSSWFCSNKVSIGSVGTPRHPRIHLSHQRDIILCWPNERK